MHEVFRLDLSDPAIRERLSWRTWCNRVVALLAPRQYPTAIRQELVRVGLIREEQPDTA